MEQRENRDYRSFDEINNTGAAISIYTAGACGGYSYNDPDDVERYRLFGAAVGADINHIIRPQQTHTDRVLVAHEENGGEGVCREGRMPHDAMITGVPGLLITVASADCVPVTLLDPVRRAAGIVHSGWRGSAKSISEKTVIKMKEEFGCAPGNIIACIGPHICEDCYEVGEELIKEFAVSFSEAEIKELFVPKSEGKYLLNLGLAVRLSLLRAGVCEENIHMSEFCTYHTDEFASWRKTGDRSKRMLNGIMLCEQND